MFLMNFIEKQYKKNKKADSKFSEINQIQFKKMIQNGKFSTIQSLYYYMLLLNIFIKRYNNFLLYQIIKIFQSTISANKQIQEENRIKFQGNCRQLMENFVKQNQFNFTSETFTKFYRAIYKIPKQIRKLLISNQLVNKIQKFLETQLKLKNQQTLKILKIVFDQCQIVEIITAQKKYQPYLKALLYKTTKIMWIYESTSFQVLNQTIIQYFLEEIILTQHKKNYQYHFNFIDIFVIYLIHMFKTLDQVLKVLDRSIKKKKQSESVANIINYILNQIFIQLESSNAKKIYDQLINEKLLFVFKLHQNIKTFVIQRILIKVKQFSKNKNQQMIHKLVSSVMTFPITQQEKDYIICQSYTINDGNTINIVQMRSALLDKIDHLNIYMKIKHISPKNTVDKMIQYTEEIKSQLNRNQISYQKLKKINEQYDEKTWEKIQKLFDQNSKMEKMRDIFSRLIKKSEVFKVNLEKIRKITRIYEQKKSEQWKSKTVKQIISEVLKIQNQFLNSEILNFQYSDKIKSFNTILNADVYKFYQNTYFRKIFQKKQFQNQKQFCSSLNETLQELIERIDNLSARYKDQTLNLTQFQEITKNCSIKQLTELLNLNKVLTEKQIKELLYIQQKLVSMKTFKKLNQSLVYLDKFFKTKTFEKLNQLTDLFQKYEIEERNNEINIGELINGLKIFEKYLFTFKLTNNGEDQENKILQVMLQAQNLWNFLDNITLQVIEELKEFLNDQEEQGFVNSKNIVQLRFAFEFYKQVLKSSNTIENFFKKLRQFLQKNINMEQSLSTSLQSCKTHSIVLQQILKKSKNRDSSIKILVSEILQNSTLSLKHDPKTNYKLINLNIQNKNKSKCNFKQLNDLRDKTLLLINSINKQKSNDKAIKQVNTENQNDLILLTKFIELYDKIDNILENYRILAYLGYLSNFVKSIAIIYQMEFPIKLKEFPQLIEHFNDVLKQREEWEKLMESTYFSSFSICHFQGKELKKLILDTLDLRMDDTTLKRVLSKIYENKEKAQNIFYQVANKQFNIEYNKAREKNNPFDQLQFISKYFNRLENLNDKQLNLPKIINKKKFEIKLVIIQQPNEQPKKQINHYYGMKAGLAKVNLKQNFGMAQILLCRNLTNQSEMRTFLLRALLDRKRPYFIISPHCLPAKIQNIFCEVLNKALENERLDKSIKSMELYLIVNSKSENLKIINFLNNNKEFQIIKIHETFNPQNCSQFFLQKAGNFKIVQSVAAGLGKTFLIQQQIKSKNLIPKYFPVAGNLELSRLYERLQQQNINDKCALIIQIHNIKDKKILDQFLFQIVFFRCLKNEGFLFLPQNLYVYIQLQNVLNEQYFNDYQTLSIFQSSAEASAKFVTTIKQVTLQNINIDQKNPKIMFVLKYLDLVKKKTINSYQITYMDFKSTYEKNNDLKIDAQQARQLLSEYLIKPLKQKNNDISFIQIQSFLSLLFQTFKIFSENHKLAIAKSFNIHQQRVKFLDSLIKNLRQSLIRENIFSQKQEKQNFNQILREIPLLVILNGDQKTFTYIYSDQSKIDMNLKKYILVYRGKIAQNNINNLPIIESQFIKDSLKDISQSPINLESKLKQLLKEIMGLPNHNIKQDYNYSLTVDNFYKMCLMAQRMRAKIPIIIMGETGVGKTALIRYLVQNVYQDQLKLINIHAGIDQAYLSKYVKQMEERRQELSKVNKRLWVFFDQFNTTEEVGYIKEIITERRFLGKQLSSDFIFLAACNPLRKKQKKQNAIKVGIEKKQKSNDDGLLYKVLAPPKSLVDYMWNFQQLKPQQSRQYIYSILSFLQYRREQISEVIHQTHEDFKKEIEKSAVNLRDVARFKILYKWFLQNMPKQRVHRDLQTYSIDYEYNFKIQREQRAFILALCFCYYMRLQSTQKRDNFLETVQVRMKFAKEHMNKVLKNQQIDYLSRMTKPKGIALNLALRQNVFTSFVCLLNKLPMIIVGMPGCSKSLSVRLLLSNLRGKSSDQQFFKNLPQIEMFQFQGSQSCRSQGIQQIFNKAKKKLLHLNRVISCILFDQIGLAELSIHNPLKVLHSNLQVNQTKVSFIGISNWELDASKMARFLVINRPLTDEYNLCDTAQQIFQSEEPKLAQKLKSEIKQISKCYYKFINQQNGHHNSFFGLRDFYSFVKYIVFNLKNDKNQGKQMEIIKRSVQRNFDGRPNSVQMFLKILQQNLPSQKLNFVQGSVLELIQENLKDKQSRCLLQIIKGQSLIYVLNQKRLKIKNNNIITIHGSTFLQDKSSQQYNLVVISDIINYIAQGYIIILKDIPNNIQTSLYDLLNKSYQTVGNKNYARIAVGANYNPKCFVHQDFNCIVYIMESELKHVDPPFLNRFEKHYLTIDKFIYNAQERIIVALEHWIDSLLNNILSKQNALLKEHYIVNVCKQSIASLAIKYGLEADDQDIQIDNHIQDAIKKCKQQLLMNSTTDFKLLLQTTTIDDNEFIEECLEQKKIFINQGILKEMQLIVYTYDKNVEMKEDNILFQENKTKVIKICEFRCQKELRNQIEQFYKSNMTSCHIKFNYEKEYTHLCMLLFLLQAANRKFNNNEKQKRIVIILMISRLSLLNNVDKRYKQISYLNGYKQIFIENLGRSSISCDQIPVQKVLLKYSKIFDFQEIISDSSEELLKRFDFVYNSDQEKQNVPLFKRLLEGAFKNNIFVQYSIKFIKERLNLPDPKNWKKQVLSNRQIAMLSPTTYDAMMKYFIIKIQDILASYIYFLLQNEVIYCFDFEASVDILQKYIPQCKSYLLNCFEECKQAYIQILIYILILLCPKPHIRLKNISKAAGGQRILLSHPKLFPFVMKQCKYILKKQKKNEQENQIKTEQSLEDICEIISNLQGKFHQQNSNEEENKVLLQSKNIQANILIEKTTRLLKKNQQEQYQYNFIELMNTKSNWKKLKEIFIFDIRNIYLQNTIQIGLELSLQFSKLLKFFTNTDFGLIQQLMILLKGSQFWKKFLNILKVFKQLFKYNPRQKDKNQKWRILFEKFKPNFEQNNLGVFYIHKIEFIRKFFQSCNINLELNQININYFEDIQKYKVIFDNVYYLLEILEKQYGQDSEYIKIIMNSSSIKINENIRLMKNLIKTLSIIEPQPKKMNDICLKFFKSAEQNIFLKINEFLEQLKKQESYKSYKQLILKYQISYLYRYWIQSINKSEKNEKQCSLFIENLIKLINQQKDFANYSLIVISQLFKSIEFHNGNIVKTIQCLAINHINDNLFLKKLNQSVVFDKFNNNLSVLLMDFMQRSIPEHQELKLPQNQKEYNIIILRLQYSEAQKVIKMLEQQTKSLSGLQKIICLAFMRNYLNYYIECLEEQRKENIMLDINKILQGKHSTIQNLRIYCMKLIRRNLGNIGEMRKKYIDIERVKWIKKYKAELQEMIKLQFRIPPDIDSKPIKKLIEQFIKSRYSNLQLLNQMFKLKSPGDRYNLYNFFLTNIYSVACNPTNQKAILDHLKLGNPNLEIFQLELLKKYASSHVTQKINFSLKEESIILQNQIFILNNINHLLSIRNSKSPLTSIFFTAQGLLPKQFSQHVKEQFILCGKQNPYRVSMENVLAISADRNTGVYICSKQCDYVYALLGCGWPAQEYQCPYCEGKISGPGHKLIRQNEGARRLGPTLIDGVGQFYMFYDMIKKVDYYWKWLKIYIEKEIQRSNQKKQISIREVKEIQNKQQIKHTVKYILTGFTKFDNTVPARLQQITYLILNITINSLIYFFVEFGWISEGECIKSFQGRTKLQMKQFTYKKIFEDSARLKQRLDHPDWKSWLMGIQKEIFEMALNYDKEVEKARIEKDKDNGIQRKNIELERSKQPNKYYKNLYTQELDRGVIFSFNIPSNFTAKICWNREYFEKIVGNIIISKNSGQEKISYIKINKNKKSESTDDIFDMILVEELLKLDKYQYLRILRLTKNASYRNMDNEYSTKINAEYPILGLLIKNIQKLERIECFFRVADFVIKITKYVQNQVSRETAKNSTIEQFIKNLRVTNDVRQSLYESAKKCIQSWNKLAKSVGVIQHECKVLGRMNDNYSLKETPLIAFLVDTLDKTNYYGKILIGVLYLFGIQQNQLISHIQSKKQSIVHLKNVRFFSENYFLPQKMTGKDVIQINRDLIQSLIQNLSSNSVEYRNGLPLYNFQVIQYKLTTQLYGKKRMITDLRQFINIQFSGEMFNRMSEYSNYITEVRNSGGNRRIEDLVEIKQKLRSIKNKNQNNYFPIMKKIQGSLQKMMIFFKNLQPKNITLKEYIDSYKFKNCPEELLTLPFIKLPVECIVNLYEQIELFMIQKTFQILPEIYKQQQLNKEEEKQFMKLFSQMQQKTDLLPTLEDFKYAFYRLISRCLVLAEISNQHMLMDYLPTRIDFWSTSTTDQILQKLSQKQNIKAITLKKTISIHKLIQKIEDKQKNKGQVQFMEEEIIKVQEKKRRNKKKQKINS